jgi:acyl carrier protein
MLAPRVCPPSRCLPEGPGRAGPCLKIATHGRLSRDAETLPLDADLYEAGMTSHASVNVMLALEGEFDLEFPDHMLKRSVFDSIGSISAAIGQLQAAA